MASFRCSFVLLFAAAILGIWMVNEVDAECCRAVTRIDDKPVCGDCTWATPFCAHGRCNVFGCNCAGGCRSGRCAYAARRRRRGVQALRTWMTSRYWIASNDSDKYWCSHFFVLTQIFVYFMSPSVAYSVIFETPQYQNVWLNKGLVIEPTEFALRVFFCHVTC